MNLLAKAKSILSSEKATFVALKGAEIYISRARGVAPILEKIDEDPSFLNGATVADKVIGKAAAMLLSKYGVREIHALLISEKALCYLENTTVTVTYEVIVPHIINRDKTGMCPMEKCVIDTTDEDEAEKLIRLKRQELMK